MRNFYEKITDYFSNATEKQNPVGYMMKDFFIAMTRLIITICIFAYIIYILEKIEAEDYVSAVVSFPIVSISVFFSFKVLSKFNKKASLKNMAAFTLLAPKLVIGELVRGIIKWVNTIIGLYILALIFEGLYYDLIIPLNIFIILAALLYYTRRRDTVL